MMRESDVHPCFSCDLPECDDTDRRCPLRRVLAEERRMRVHGEQVGDVLRRQRSIAYRELYYITRDEKRREARS